MSNKRLEERKCFSSAYGPGSEEEIRNRSWKELTLLERLRPKKRIVVLGYLNAMIGEKCKGHR